MVASSDTRKKRVSKKSKKSWRKNTDTADVDAFLDDIRLEERLGGSFAERSNDQLFKIDKVARKKGIPDENNKLLTKKERRSTSKPLRCFDKLKNDSCVKDPVIKRNRVRKAGEGKIHIARKVKEQLRTLRKDTLAMRDRAMEDERKAKSKQIAHVNLDLWDDNALGPDLLGDATWLRPQTLVHTVQNIAKKIGKKPKASLKKNSVLPAVEAPHPGESYNPSQEDHQALLQKVVDHELKLIKQEKHIERVTTKMYGKPSERPTVESRLVEMSEGLPFTLPNGQAIVDDGSDTEFRALNPPVQNRKKTMKKRRSLKAVRDMELQKAAYKLEKKKISDIYRLRKLEEEMAATQAEQARLRGLREIMKARRAIEPKQMSHHKFQEAELEFNMPGELRGNVRSLRSEGNLLADRFKSLQKRNVIETRVKQKMKRKYKLKKLTKKTHKQEPVL